MTDQLFKHRTESFLGILLHIIVVSILCPVDEGTFFTVDDDDFGLDSLAIFKSASAHFSSNDCYYGRRGSSCNHITLRATVWYCI